VALALSIDPELVGKVLLGVLSLDDVTVRELDPALDAEVAARCEDLRARHRGRSSGEVPGVAAARSLYRGLGIDPTKTRPSNEALLRRALKGEPLYRINTLVDALNLCSLLQQLPYGLYDRDQVRGSVSLRRGRSGEAYEGIRKGPVNVTDRPVLVDEVGPFGNPTSDSARTQVRLTTANVLVIAFAPPSLERACLEEVLDGAEELLTRFCGGARRERCVLPAPW
jgi:DNA/RNA-binding domain of Phe-tRNA-synthetase-like protein